MIRRQSTAIEVPTRLLAFPESLLNRLDALSTEFPWLATRRVYPRYRYRRAVDLTIVSVSEAQSNLRVCTRNISSGGLSFLHTQPLLLDSEITLWLPDLNGTLHSLDAIVRASSLVEASIHEMGAEFDNPIDVAAFVGPDPELQVRTG